MSIHGCNELCNKDIRFHVIQKNEGHFVGEQATSDEMKSYLGKRIGESVELLELLD